jgi:hypothetical protein
MCGLSVAIAMCRSHELSNVVQNLQHSASRSGKSLRIPAMLYAASDDSMYPSKGTSNLISELPAGLVGVETFRIGVATTNGQTWPQVSNLSSLHYVFPGVDILDFVRLQEAAREFKVIESYGPLDASKDPIVLEPIAKLANNVCAQHSMYVIELTQGCRIGKRA